METSPNIFFDEQGNLWQVMSPYEADMWWTQSVMDEDLIYLDEDLVIQEVSIEEIESA